MFKNINNLLFVALIISLIGVVCINGSSPPSTVVNILNNSTQFQLQYFSLNSGNSIANVSVPNEGGVAITSIDFDSVTFISQDSTAFFFNQYDISTKSFKVISSISYPNETFGIGFSFQQINSNAPSLGSEFTLLGKNDSNYLFYLKLDFEQTIYTLVEASQSPTSGSSYFNGGYDYLSSTYYFTYIDGNFCNNFASVNSTLEPVITEVCINNVASLQDRTMPIMFNSTSYFITAVSDSNEVDITLFAVYESGPVTMIDKLEIFSFYNCPNVLHFNYQPINFVSISNEYATIALYSALEKYQYVTINMNNYYMTSVLTNRSNRLDSIYTF